MVVVVILVVLGIVAVEENKEYIGWVMCCMRQLLYVTSKSSYSACATNAALRAVINQIMLFSLEDVHEESTVLNI